MHVEVTPQSPDDCLDLLYAVRRYLGARGRRALHPVEECTCRVCRCYQMVGKAHDLLVEADAFPWADETTPDARPGEPECKP